MDALYSQDLDRLSRREFLQWTQRGLLGLFTLLLAERGQGKERIAPLTAPLSDEPTPELGRVLDNKLSLYMRPSFSSRLVNMYWRDLVLPINGVTVGDGYPDYNRVWYLVNNEGYAHSGNIQPVAVRQNQPASSVPETGVLAEVTVPFTDALRDPNRHDWFVYRLYYSTVFWVTAVVQDKQGGKWYRIPDDKRRTEYYASAAHLRIIPATELAPIPPLAPNAEKRLEVRLADQVLVGYEGSRPVFMTRIASGGHFLDGDYTTPAGSYITNRKRPSRHMASEDLAAPSAYDLPGVPWVCYLTKSGISFHGTYWHNDFGKPRSHGCINLSPQAAKWVYRWTAPAVPYAEATFIAEEGTKVDILD